MLKGYKRHDSDDPLTKLLADVPDEPEGGIKDEARSKGNRYEDMTIGKVVVDMGVFRKKGLADIVGSPRPQAAIEAESIWIKWRSDNAEKEATLRSKNYLWILSKIASSLIPFSFPFL